MEGQGRGGLQPPARSPNDENATFSPANNSTTVTDRRSDNLGALKRGDKKEEEEKKKAPPNFRSWGRAQGRPAPRRAPHPAGTGPPSRRGPEGEGGRWGNAVGSEALEQV